MKKLLVFFMLLFVFRVSMAWEPSDIVSQFQGMSPEAVFTDNDGVQRFIVSSADSFCSVWWIYPDSLPDSASVFVSDSATDMTFTFRAVTDTVNVNDEVIGKWYGTTNYHVGFVAFRWLPVDWGVDEMVFGSPRLFRVEIDKQPLPVSPTVNFMADP